MNKTPDNIIKRIIEAKEADETTTSEIAISLNVSKDVVVKYWREYNKTKKGIINE